MLMKSTIEIELTSDVDTDGIHFFLYVGEIDDPLNTFTFSWDDIVQRTIKDYALSVKKVNDKNIFDAESIKDLEYIAESFIAIGNKITEEVKNSKVLDRKIKSANHDSLMIGKMDQYIHPYDEWVKHNHS